MSKREVRLKSDAAASLFLESDIYKKANVVMLYMPLGNEVDTSGIMRAAFDDGKMIALPITDSEDKIYPCFIDKDTGFKKGKFSVTEPVSSERADVKKIDLVIVPGIAFDILGGRIGFGKGCYDTFLKGTTATKVGLCYDFQLLKRIETDPQDVAMDYIITESRIIKIQVGL